MMFGGRIPHLLFAFVCVASVARAGQFYGDRPHIGNAASRPATAYDEPVSERQLRSMLDFVIELRLLYGDRKRVYLGRDGESLYEIDWLLSRFLKSSRSEPEPLLINVSRKNVGSQLLTRYLVDQGVLSTHEASLIFVDTGYEGSVIDAINRRLSAEGHNEIKAHLISSVHEKSPSSRVATQAYLPEEWDGLIFSRAEHKEPFLDLVDRQITDIEEAPHFTSTSTEFRVNPRTAKLDAYSEKDRRSGEAEKSVAVQRQIYRFIVEESRARERVERILSTLGPVIESITQGDVSASQVRLAYDFSVKQRFHLFWWDLREAFIKKCVRVPREAIHQLWRALPTGTPTFFDMTEEQEAGVLRKEAEARALVSDNQRSGVELPKETPDSAGRLLIEDILSFHQSEKQHDVQKVRGRELAKAREQMSSGQIQINGEVLTIGEKLDEGYRAEVFELGTDYILKVPFEADDTRYIAVECLVADYLSRHQDRYPIRILPIVAQGPSGTFLVRRRVSSNQLGQAIIKQGLTPEQREDLRELFEASKRFAMETGVGLDTKYDNLAWVEGHWVLFDVGPRTSYGPYAFTLDLPTFDDYVRLWKKDSPRSNGISIEEVIRQFRTGGGCGKPLRILGGTS